VRPRLRHNFFLDAFDPVTGQHMGRRVEVLNLFTDAGLGVLRDFLYGDAVQGLEYFGLGDGAGAITAASTVLNVERYRDVFTQITKSGPKQLTVKVYVGSLQANGYTYTKAGLFGNTAATAAVNTGTLFAALTFAAQAKTTAEAWTFTWVIDILDDGV
jgi:hypothetical protein